MTGRTRLRVGNCCVGVPTVAVRVDGGPTESVRFGTVGEYHAVAAGAHEVTVAGAREADHDRRGAGGPDGAGTPEAVEAPPTLLTRRIETRGDTAHTVVAAGDGDDVVPVVLDDGGVETRPGSAAVRVVNCVADATAMDVAVRDGPRLFVDVQYRETSGYVPVPTTTAGVTVCRTRTDETLLDLPTAAFADGGTYTVLAAGRGDRVGAVVVTDGAAATGLRDEPARAD